MSDEFLPIRTLYFCFDHCDTNIRIEMIGNFIDCYLAKYGKLVFGYNIKVVQ